MRVPNLGPSVLSFGSALLASSCCLLPLAIVLLGLGSGAFMAVTMKWRPVFVPAALLGLGASYYWYVRTARQCRATGCPMIGRRFTLGVLIFSTIITGVSLFLILFPEAGAALLAAAFTSSTSSETVSPSEQQTAWLRLGPKHAGHLTVHLSMSPNPPRMGEVGFEVKLTNAAGAPVDDAAVELDFSMPGMKMAENRMQPKPVGGGRYVGTGMFPMGGAWEIEVRIKMFAQKLVTRFSVNVR